MEDASGRQEERYKTLHRSNSDSSLYCKAGGGPTERKVHPEKPVTDQAKYLDQEKLAFVQDYLEQAEDVRSMTTETSDSGMPGTHGAPSELGIEETSGKLNATFVFSRKPSKESLIVFPFFRFEVQTKSIANHFLKKKKKK